MIALREIGFEDLDAARRLVRSVGWGAPTREDWERLFVTNPAQRAGDPLPRGWVLEEKDEVQGMALCLAQTYRLEQRKLRAAIFASLVVEPRARGSTMKLVTAYLRQKVDLLLSPGSAADTVKLLKFFKVSTLPQPGYDVAYFWVTRSRGFLEAALRKKGLSRALALPASVLGAPLVWAESAWNGRHPGAESAHEMRVLAPSQLGGSFDELWERKLAEGPKLLADRSAETLRWHFSRPVEHPPFFVAAYSGDRLDGYAAVVRQDAPQLGLSRARVADLLVARDDRDTTRELLAAAIREAGARGAEMVELVGFPESVRSVAAELRPFTLPNGDPFHFKAADPQLHAALSKPDLWHASLYDGDGSL